MKTLEFIYQDTEIHFALGNQGDVMVNATEMAKLFNKEVRSFLRLEGTKKYIGELLQKMNSDRTDVYGQKTEKDIFYTTNKATYLHRKLAVKFAAWLDVKFEVWIFDTIDDILFGHYKEHWDAHMIQEKAKKEMNTIKEQILLDPTPELVSQYFEKEQEVNNAKLLKQKAIRNQLKLSF